jgi:hypothetical protein
MLDLPRILSFARCKTRGVLRILILHLAVQNSIGGRNASTRSAGSSRLRVGLIVKERWRRTSALVSLSVAEEVANFHKKFDNEVLPMIRFLDDRFGVTSLQSYTSQYPSA